MRLISTVMITNAITVWFILWPYSSL